MYILKNNNKQKTTAKPQKIAPRLAPRYLRGTTCYGQHNQTNPQNHHTNDHGKFKLRGRLNHARHSSWDMASDHSAYNVGSTTFLACFNIQHCLWVIKQLNTYSTGEGVSRFVVHLELMELKSLSSCLQLSPPQAQPAAASALRAAPGGSCYCYGNK